MKNDKQLRQGDLIIECVDAVPAEAVKLVSMGGRFVLADGEATGHAHTITAESVELYERNGVLYCAVSEPAEITHQEHAAHTLAPGVYRVRRQIVEDAEHAPRQVTD